MCRSDRPTWAHPTPDLRNAAGDILSTAARRARKAAPALDISTALLVCSPAAALIDASHDAALVVAGHRGLGGFTGLLLGSVSVQTAAHADCPVVIVRDSDAVKRRARSPRLCGLGLQRPRMGSRGQGASRIASTAWM